MKQCDFPGCEKPYVVIQGSWNQPGAHKHYCLEHSPDLSASEVPDESAS